MLNIKYKKHLIIFDLDSGEPCEIYKDRLEIANTVGNGEYTYQNISISELKQIMEVYDKALKDGKYKP